MHSSSQDISCHHHSHIHFPPTSIAPNQPSRDLTTPVHHISPIPAFYLHRDNGVAVPLIALDELPPWLRIGREDWFNPEWQQYMNPVSDEPTIRVGEYEVFATWGGAVYHLPTWKLVAVRGARVCDGTAAGTGWELEVGGERGRDIIHHLDRRGGYDYEVDERMIGNGCLDGKASSPGCSGGGRSGGRHAARDQDGEPIPIANDEVNREGITRNVPDTPPSSPMGGLCSGKYDGNADERFSCSSCPLSRNGHYHHYPHYPQDQQDQPPRQQTAMSSSPHTWPLELSPPLSNNSCSSPGQNPLHSLPSNTETETSMSSWDSFDILPPAFHVPVLPRTPLGLGLTQSAPSCVLSGMFHGRIPPWLRNRAEGDGSVCSV
ncbi:hypothetical protein RJZ56_004785 [Blastomyces dermatitidis]|uniref:Uncharacterized protein n=2 Tax=Ajellomyces dermatitidis TaxID=5039 RepID=F2T1P1_AJEDA|nr:uncharacterized protein BDCG_03579 [Blastomyces dermatitidis ER-3]EEQ88459.1 hypothetical protein BDCG_03579 [Blastomyces dermatitidis ER-3]EGE77375.1 hypothetical protein BDDG_00312 [Blastomyces dermatitidis ATCC 18188]